MNPAFYMRRLPRFLPVGRVSKPTLFIFSMLLIFCLNWALPLRSLLSTPVKATPSHSRERRQDKLFCWILTSSDKHNNRVPAVNETWPKRCDKALFYTDVPMNDTYPHEVVFDNMTEGILNLWPKTKEAMRFTHEHFLQEFDWFFKADDDTFVIVENLRFLLSKFDPSLPHFLGFRIAPYAKDGYNSGGAGYVLSRPALKLLVEQLLPNITLCPDGAAEDLQLAICLSKLGILPGDSRDEKQRNTFLPFRFDEHFNGKMPMGADPKYWYYYPMKLGWEAFSENVVTLHHLSPQEIRLFELLVYKVKVADFAN